MIFSGINNQYRATFRGLTNLDSCSFCGQPANDEAPLHRFCNCPRSSHLNCLIRHIQFNRESYCLICLIPFQNVRIIYPNRSCGNWLREDTTTRQTAIRFVTIVFLIIYLEYLSLIQIATQYQIMSAIERYLLQILMFIFLYFFLVVLLMFVLFMLHNYITFRRTTGHVNVIPLIQNFNQSSHRYAFQQAKLVQFKRDSEFNNPK